MSKLRPFCMPKWGIEMTEGTVAEWMVGEGDRVKRGDTICLIETAKITNEVEAENDCVILRVLAPAGEDVLPVGALLAVFGDDDAPASEVDAFIAAFVPAEGGVGEAPVASGDKPAKPAAAPAATPKKIETNRPISPEALALAEREGADLDAPVLRGAAELAPEDLRIFASPLARRLAALHGVDLSGLTGTGPRGRISKHDVLAAMPKPAATGGAFALAANSPRIAPFDKVRGVIAQRLTAAKRDIPHFYLRVAVDVDALLTLRKTANLVLGTKASINDYLVLAAGRALARHPDVNVQLHGDAVHHFPHADIAVAVASPKGLVTPIVRQVDRMTLPQLAAATAAQIDKAKAGRLSWEDLDGGTFTISNLGMFGIDDFDAVINPPQGAILAVGRARREAVESDDGGIDFATMISLSLSVDHRAIDGAAGAQFLATLKSLIEDPEQLF
ncbi:MAG: 2-oxo acid dehydrogenase subunit E2 [Novosphingobium sp.]|nr:2-oxo acid dehydrogenase subunit E2 [Novosphingobium sp.]